MQYYAATYASPYRKLVRQRENTWRGPISEQLVHVTSSEKSYLLSALERLHSSCTNCVIAHDTASSTVNLTVKQTVKYHVLNNFFFPHLRQQIGYLAEELKDPLKSIPRALLGGISAVSIVYLLTNLSYLVVLDKSTLFNVESTAVSFGIQTWGPIATTVIPIGVAFSAFGGIFAGFFSNTRLAFAAARNGHLPSVLTLVTVRSSVPLSSVLLRGLLASVYTLAGSVGFVIQGVAFIFNFYSFLTMLSLFLLRFTNKQPKGVYRAPTVLMLLRVVILIFLLIVPLVKASEPLLGLVIFLNFVVGCFLYAVFRSKMRTSPVLSTLTSFAQKLLVCVPCE